VGKGTDLSVPIKAIPIHVAIATKAWISSKIDELPGASHQGL
jgi:hypothetical protein